MPRYSIFVCFGSRIYMKQKNIVTKGIIESIISDQSNRNKAFLTKNQNPKYYGEDSKKLIYAN